MKRVAKREPKRKKVALSVPPKSQVSRDLILRVAAQLFRQQGYSATTLRQIADKAGMKAGSIYYHFDSKDDAQLRQNHRYLLGHNSHAPALARR